MRKVAGHGLTGREKGAPVRAAQTKYPPELRRRAVETAWPIPGSTGSTAARRASCARAGVGVGVFTGDGRDSL